MYLIITRAFPPELGGMQSLMWGLTKEMSKNFMIKVFADYHENHKEFDNKENFSIERVGGIKFLRKIRKAQLINEFIKENKIQGIIADHWKSLELIKTDKKKYCLIHGKEINHPKGSSLNKRIVKVLNNVEKVIANSEYTKNLAINNGVNRDKVIIINPGVGIVEENTGSAIAGAIPGTTEKEGDSTAEKAGKGILRSVIGLLTYQRTIRVVRPDPKHCMYNIRNWESAKALLNEKHKEHSQSNLLKDLKDTIVASGDED